MWQNIRRSVRDTKMADGNHEKLLVNSQCARRDSKQAPFRSVTAWANWIYGLINNVRTVSIGYGTHPYVIGATADGLSSGIKRPEYKANIVPPTGVEIKNEWSYISSVPTPLRCSKSLYYLLLFSSSSSHIHWVITITYLQQIVLLRHVVLQLLNTYNLWCM